MLYGLVSFGGFSLITYPLIYVAGLYLYARTLRSLVIQLPETQRLIRPKLVWLVVALPFNFVATFYVITQIGQSLRADGRITVGTIRRWTVTGLSWAALQIMAFFPSTTVSFVMMLLAYGGWAAHWLQSVGISEQLKSRSGASHER